MTLLRASQFQAAVDSEDGLDGVDGESHPEPAGVEGPAPQSQLEGAGREGPGQSLVNRVDLSPPPKRQSAATRRAPTRPGRGVRV